MKKYIWLIILIFTQLVLSDTYQPNQIRLVTTANVHGETDPCG